MRGDLPEHGGLMAQLHLLGAEPDLPPGFDYYPDFISPQEEEFLLSGISHLKFEHFQFHGYEAKRRVVHFGYGYAFNRRSLTKAEPLPSFLEPLRKKVAKRLKVKPELIAEVLVTHYPETAPIGWHRDAPSFESLFGISLQSPCVMKLRKLTQEKSSLRQICLEPRSGYAIQGEARWLWQHHIPPQKGERYSITFRTLKRENLTHDRDL
jgi:alkylated DNA repair dioxygenase AlkB